MPATILMIEDNPITREMVRLAPSAEGYHVLEAPDGAWRKAIGSLLLLDGPPGLRGKHAHLHPEELVAGVHAPST